MNERTTKTLQAIDDLITDWQDWEAEDASPDPRAQHLREAFDTIRPLWEQAPALVIALRNCSGAMSTLRHQVDQMSGMFNDEDGTIQEACDAHDAASAEASAFVTRLGLFFPDEHQMDASPPGNGISAPPPLKMEFQS